MSNYEGMSKVIADKEKKLFICEYCGRIVERPYVHNNLLGPDRTTKVICTQPDCNRFLDYSAIHEEYQKDFYMAIELGLDPKEDKNYIINFSLNRQLGIYDELRLPKDRKPEPRPFGKSYESMTELYTKMMVDGHLKQSATYSPPISITKSLDNLYSTMVEQRENDLVVNVSQQIGIDIDKERLLKALEADEELYSLQQRIDFLERCLSRACQLLYGVAKVGHESSDAAARRKPIDWRCYIVNEQIRADNAVSNLVKLDTNDEEDEE